MSVAERIEARYDSEAGAANVSLFRSPFAYKHTVEVAPDVLVDLDTRGNPTDIEFLDPDRRVDDLGEVLERFGLHGWEDEISAALYMATGFKFRFGDQVSRMNGRCQYPWPSERLGGSASTA